MPGCVFFKNCNHQVRLRIANNGLLSSPSINRICVFESTEINVSAKLLRYGRRNTLWKCILLYGVVRIITWIMDSLHGHQSPLENSPLPPMKFTLQWWGISMYFKIGIVSKCPSSPLKKNKKTFTSLTKWATVLEEWLIGLCLSFSCTWTCTNPSH